MSSRRVSIIGSPHCRNFNDNCARPIFYSGKGVTGDKSNVLNPFRQISTIVAYYKFNG
jgi:hypothetical protein